MRVACLAQARLDGYINLVWRIRNSQQYGPVLLANFGFKATPMI